MTGFRFLTPVSPLIPFLPPLADVKLPIDQNVVNRGRRLAPLGAPQCGDHGADDARTRSLGRMGPGRWRATAGPAVGPGGKKPLQRRVRGWNGRAVVASDHSA